MMPIVANKAPAPVIKSVAILAHAGDGFITVEVCRIKAKIHAAEVDRLRILLAAANDLPAAQAVGDVNPAIDAKDRMIDSQLRILSGETLEQHLALIGLPIAVGVFEVENVRRRRHDDAALPRHQSIGEQQLVGKDGAVLVEAIAVAVFENLDTPFR